MDDREDARTIERELAALHPASFGWALACCRRDHGLAEEVLQDAYFKVLDGRARFDRRSSLKTWLFGVIRMTAREHRRWSVLSVSSAAQGGCPPSSPTRAAPLSEAAARAAPAVAHARAPRQSGSAKSHTSCSTRTSRSPGEAAEVMGVALRDGRQHLSAASTRSRP
ncbi:MAG: hypothetical protein KIS78_06475 [Labilithrix sp.]|nr:hypothetical protein [Labilithrix sp.]